MVKLLRSMKGNKTKQKRSYSAVSVYWLTFNLSQATLETTEQQDKESDALVA